MRNFNIFLTAILCFFLITGVGSFLVSENRQENFVAQDNENQLMDIKEFVNQTFIHGVPYEEVVKYDPNTTVPVLITMLKDPNGAAARSNIATTLGMLGDPRAIEPLIELIESVDGVLSPSEYNARISAIGALGFILNRQMNNTAFNYLKSQARLNFINTNKIKWLSPYEENLEDRNIRLAKTAIIGLGLSGRPEATTFLNSLQQNFLRSRPLSTRIQNVLNSTINDALIANDTIQKGKENGLKNYFNKNKQ